MNMILTEYTILYIILCINHVFYCKFRCSNWAFAEEEL